MEQDLSEILSDTGLDLIFRKARTHSVWLDKPVSDVLLQALYDLLRWGPTTLNSGPARLVFLRSPEAKQRLLPALSPGNRDKTLAAPVTVIVAYDLRFYDHLPKLFPQNPAAKDGFKDPKATETVALRNSSLQGAYLIVAARALGLDCGPMSGFDNAKVDAEFFPDGRLKSNFLCNLAYGDASQLKPRNPRLSFDEACQII